MTGTNRKIEIEVEKVNAERTSVRFTEYSDGKIWLNVTFMKEENRQIGSLFKDRIFSLFKCREFYDEKGVLANRGNTVIIPKRTFHELQTKAKAILR